jgi:hypothetical protein
MVGRRQFLLAGLAAAIGGCKSTPHAEVRDPNKPDMVGSHQAGTETFKPLVEKAMGDLLARHSTAPMQTATGELLPPQQKRICFVRVENKSSEEIGDFKDQIYQIIDLHITNSGVFAPVNARFISAGLAQTRLNPDALMIPQNMRTFAAVMEQQGQPFDFLLYATLTSGTTRENKETQKDYLLTLELVNVHDGSQDKQAATLSKGYYHSFTAKLMSNLGLKR